MWEYYKTLLLSFLSPYLPKSEKGQDLTEYGLLIAFIALLVVVAVLVFSGAVGDFFNRLSTNINGWAP